MIEFVLKQNQKKLLTPGPASLTVANLMGLAPAFGRGDEDYQTIEERVLTSIKQMVGMKYIARLQGSATLALEIAIRNFVSGKVLVVNSGYYSDRLYHFCDQQLLSGKISKLKQIDCNLLDQVSENYDWIVSCYVETSKAIKLDILKLHQLKISSNAKLLLDATASIGLEDNHNLADVVAFSSCKGLFGLTGASFITFNQPAENAVDSFYLNINSHLNKKMTGPYHTICSLDHILKKYSRYKKAVEIGKQVFMKRYKNFITIDQKNQPLLCTHVNGKISSDTNDYIFYQPRINNSGSIVCHLGEVHLMESAKGEIYDQLKIS